MDGDHFLGLDEFERFKRVFRAHGEGVADGEQGQVDAGFADQRHVGKERGVTGMVDLFAVEFDDHAHRHATVAAVGERTGVPGGVELEPAAVKVVTSADVHGPRVRPFLARATGDFKGRDHERTGALRNWHRVTPVIAVGVGDDDEIGGDLIRARRRQRVSAQERIDEDRGLSTSDQRGRVPEETYFYHDLHLQMRPAALLYQSATSPFSAMAARARLSVRCIAASAMRRKACPPHFSPWGSSRWRVSLTW